jgi:hypothetical protein
MAGAKLKGAKPFPQSRLSRAFFAQKLLIMWERILPALVPFGLWGGGVAVAGQWGLFVRLLPAAHYAVLGFAFLLAMAASIKGLLHFEVPSFTEINNRLAEDNGVSPEFLIGLRHKEKQPKLKVGKAKAGIAKGDPLALRFVIVAAALFGFVILGPVPIQQICAAFVP